MRWSVFEQEIHDGISGCLSGTDQVQADLLTGSGGDQCIAVNRLAGNRLEENQTWLNLRMLSLETGWIANHHRADLFRQTHGSGVADDHMKVGDRRFFDGDRGDAGQDLAVLR